MTGDLPGEGGGAQASAPASPRPPRKTYVTHPPVIWARARERYLAGATAGEVARAMGVSVSAVRLQASRGGWTRRDLAAGGAAGAAGAAVGSGEGDGGEGDAPGGRFAPPLPVDDPDRGVEPTWIRLSDEAWEAIGGEYAGGARAKTLSKKWGVSPGSIYRRAREEGWTKKAQGATVSARMLARETTARARKAEAEADAAEAAMTQASSAPAEGDPLVAAGLLLRRAAGAATRGASEEARSLVALSQALRAASDAYVGPWGLNRARKQGSEALALAARLSWYEDLRAEFEGEGRAMPSPMECAWLAVGGGPPEGEASPAEPVEADAAPPSDGRQPSSDISAPGCARESH